eukprot:COSAG01_NODE_390_length_17672_cov_8.513287_17_plen_141_part_00
MHARMQCMADTRANSRGEQTCRRGGCLGLPTCAGCVDRGAQPGGTETHTHTQRERERERERQGESCSTADNLLGGPGGEGKGGGSHRLHSRTKHVNVCEVGHPSRPRGWSLDVGVVRPEALDAVEGRTERPNGLLVALLL